MQTPPVSAHQASIRLHLICAIQGFVEIIQSRVYKTNLAILTSVEVEIFYVS